MKRSTQLRQIGQSILFFFLLPIEISFSCFFNILLSCRCSLRFPDYSSNDNGNFREKHHSIALSIKGVTFTSGTNEKLSFLGQYLHFNFFFFSHKDHSNTFTMSQK